MTEHGFWIGVLVGVFGVIGLSGIGLIALWFWGMQDWTRFGAP